MQTHMPYEGKYDNVDYQVSGNDNNRNVEHYLQDIHYSGKALKDFTQELEKLPERTLVVFFGAITYQGFILINYKNKMMKLIYIKRNF